MSATLKLTHKAIGVEGPSWHGTMSWSTVSVSGPVEMNDTIEIPIEAGHHTLQARNGPKLEPHSDLRRGRGPGRRVPMHRKEVLADPFSCRSSCHTPGALAPSGVAGALRIERFLSHSSGRAPVQTRR